MVIAGLVLLSACAGGDPLISRATLLGRVHAALSQRGLAVTSVACDPKDQHIVSGDTFTCRYTTATQQQGSVTATVSGTHDNWTVTLGP